MSTGAFPELTALAGHTAGTASEDGPLPNPDRQFEAGLATLLDGIGRHYAIP